MIVSTFENREAWLAARRDPTALGASEVAMALGVSPYGTPFDLWERKGGLLGPKRETEVLSRGNRWEPVVLQEYEEASGNRVVHPGDHYGKPGHIVTIAREDTPWLRESPDAFAVDDSGEFGHVEAKTALHRDVWSPEPGIVIESWDDSFATMIPPHYVVQVYTQLAVSGLPWNDVCALVPMGGWLGVRWVRVMRDVETQNELVEQVTEWREKHLVNREVPTVDGSGACNRWIARKFGKVDARAERDATDEERLLIDELKAIRAIEKANKKRGAVLSNTLALAAGSHKLMLSRGRKPSYAQAETISGRSSVDVDAMRADAPHVVRAYELLSEKHTSRGEPYVRVMTYPKESE